MNAANRQGWSENQIKDTVKAYFKLLADQTNERIVNKKAIYTALSERHPQRSIKAFEAKFLNISAILYEENLPYCDGLKPRFNYQNLLKLVVLDHLKRNPAPHQEPHDILFRKLTEIKSKGYLSVVGRGTGRYGLTIEHNLGIPPNSDKQADFMGIELKTKHSNTLQTLFSRTPGKYVGCADKSELVTKFGYQDDARNRKALYTSFNSAGDTLGFALSANSDRILVSRQGKPILEYDPESIETALLSKHSQTAFINLSVRKHHGREQCCPEFALYCKWPSIIRFIKLVNDGDIYLDFTLSQKNGRTNDHGFLWRIRTESLPKLYLFTKEQALD